MVDEKVFEKFSKKLDGVADDVRTNTYRIDKLESANDSRFDQVDLRFDQIDQNMEAIKSNLDSIADKLNLMSNQFTAVAGRVMGNDERRGDGEIRVELLETQAH